jgi:hypothetical protein
VCAKKISRNTLNTGKAFFESRIIKSNLLVNGSPGKKEKYEFQRISNNKGKSKISYTYPKNISIDISLLFKKNLNLNSRS